MHSRDWPFTQRYEHIVRSWLRTRFQLRDQNGDYQAHEPIYGVGRGNTEGGHDRRCVRLFDLLEIVGSLEPSSVLDVGSAEGYFCHLVEELFGVPAFATDLSPEACMRASELFGLRSAAASAASLPFPDGAFDVVVLAEVLEHVVDPVCAILEAQRVARRFVLISTEEWCGDEKARDHILSCRSLENHMERNVFSEVDLVSLFGDAEFRRQPQRFPCPTAVPIEDRESLVSLLNGERPTSKEGVILCIAVGDSVLPSMVPPLDAQKLADVFLRDHTSGCEPVMSMAADELAFECPSCHRGCLVRSKSGMDCGECHSKYPSAAADTMDLYHFIEFDANMTRLSSALGVSDRRARDLQLLDAKFLISPTDRRSWTSETLFDGDSAWSFQNIELEEPAGSTFQTSTSDPQLVSPYLALGASGVREVTVALTMHDQVDTDQLELFWLPAGQFEFTQDLSCSRVVHPVAGKEMSVVFALPRDAGGDSGFIVRLRIDPSSVGTQRRLTVNAITVGG